MPRHAGGVTPYLVSTVGVDAVDEVPVGILHVLEADIPEDTSVVEQNIDTTEVLDGSFDDGLAVLDAVVVGNRLAAGGADLLNNDICGLVKTSADGPKIRNWLLYL